MVLGSGLRGSEDGCNEESSGREKKCNNFSCRPRGTSPVLSTPALAVVMASRDDEVVGLEGKPIENTPLVSKHQFYGEKIKLFLLCYVPRSMFNIVALGFIFMILFTAFSPSQVRFWLPNLPADTRNPEFSADRNRSL